MTTPPRSTDRIGTQIAGELAAEVACSHFGTVARRQLLALGIGDARIRSWLLRGRLHRVYPGVYAWGRPELGPEGRLAAALLFAGEGSALGGLSMLWWRGLLGREPKRVHLDAPGAVAPVPGLDIRHPLEIRRSMHRGLPVIAVPDALIPAARSLSHNALRLVIARVEYGRLSTLSEIEHSVRPGRHGGAAVRAALAAHLPQLARCENRLEREFVLLCESGAVEIPEPNVRIGRFRPDMLWMGRRLIVELDGERAHSTAAQRANDARRQAYLESLGFRVERFGPDDVFVTGAQTLAAVRAALTQGPLSERGPRRRSGPLTRITDRIGT